MFISLYTISVVNMPHPLKDFFPNTEHDIPNKKYHPNYEGLTKIPPG